MSFLPCRVAGLSLRDRVSTSNIRREIRVELLLLHVERNQLRWFGHRVRFLLDVSLRRCFRYVHPGRDRGHAGDIKLLGWFGNVSVSPRRSWWTWPERRTSGSGLDNE